MVEKTPSTGMPGYSQLMYSLLKNIVIESKPGLFLEKFFQTKQYSEVGLLVDENTKKNCYPKVRNYLPPHSIITTKSGEGSKTLSTCAFIWNRFIQENIDKYSLIVVLGGGVLGDMGGFCAATFKRGVDFLLIPTTLLAQVDAGIGGKLGVNFNTYKNQIGLFQAPCATLISPSFLDTLPERVLRSGYAEVIKHYLVADLDGWQNIRVTGWKDHNWTECIEHAVQLKMQIVRKDPYEKGMRKILNFGHTVGHAVESQFFQRGIFHGEAISVGLIAEAHIAFQKKYIDEQTLSQIADYIMSVFEKYTITDVASILEGMRQDKKNKNRKIMMTLLRSIGKAEWDVEVGEKEINRSLHYYNSL